MMRSILMNQNNNIINAFILWKTNIDKELEGIEECKIIIIICIRSYLLLYNSFYNQGITKVSL